MGDVPPTGAGEVVEVRRLPPLCRRLYTVAAMLCVCECGRGSRDAGDGVKHTQTNNYCTNNGDNCSELQAKKTCKMR